MRFIDCIIKRKDVIEQESEGLNLAIGAINEFEARRFTFKAPQTKYSGINAETLLKLLQNEVNSSLIVYRYTTKVKKFKDRKGRSQMHIRLIGRAGMMSKYNPLDIKMDIITESAFL